jgi:chromosome partitioning protein
MEKPVKRSGASKHEPVQAKLTKFNPPEMVRIISICNQKGGCGKTTTTINVAAGLAKFGQKVLVVDLDSQCNATTGLGILAEDVEKSIFDLMVDPKKNKIEDVILETQYENLHLAPGSIELSEFENRMSTEIGRENRLKKLLIQLQTFYDYILIDTPPSLGLLSINSLNASNEVMIALQAHPFAFDGLHLLLDTISLIKEELNPTLKISGLVVTMFDSRTKISREIFDKVNNMKELEGVVFKTTIRQNIRLAEAAKARRSIYHFDPICSGAVDYLHLSEEICSQNQVKKTHKKKYKLLTETEVSK